MAYNKAQWRESFEGQLGLLRPHLSGKLLDVMSRSEWHRQGVKDVDPVVAAKATSARLDATSGPTGGSDQKASGADGTKPRAGKRSG